MRKKSLNVLTIMFAITLFAQSSQASMKLNSNLTSESEKVYSLTQAEKIANVNSLSVTNKFDLQKGVVMLNSGY